MEHSPKTPFATCNSHKLQKNRWAPLEKSIEKDYYIPL